MNLVPNDFSKLKPYCSDASIAYLKNSLVSLERGRPPTPDFPLYGQRDDVKFRSDLDTLLQKSDSPTWLQEYEHTRLAKLGSQGGVPQWRDLKEDFMLYATAPKDVRYVDEAIVQEMRNEYRKLRCNALSLEDALNHLKRTDKIESRAAGWSEYQLKKTDPLAQRIALKYARDGRWKHGYAYVFSRYSKLKLRIFMPMPFSSMILQSQWFTPFMAAIQMSLLEMGSQSPYVLWADKIGFEKCFTIMESELQAAHLADDEYIVYFSNDFEKMDTRTASHQYDSFVLPCFHAAFGNTMMDEPISFTTNAPIITPSGTLTGDHGTASGAEMTNCGETLCNDYFQRRLLKVLKNKCATWRLAARRGNGDDSINIFFVKKSCALPTFKRHLQNALGEVCSETGFDAQLDKLEISDTFGKYCQNVLAFERGKLFWTYPITLVYNSIHHPEHQYKPKDWDKDYRDLDIIQKLDNAAKHPAYVDFLEWIRAGMKYPLLGSSETETKRILSKYDSYRKLQSLGERYNRQDYKISMSPTVSYILSQRT